MPLDLVNKGFTTELLKLSTLRDMKRLFLKQWLSKRSLRMSSQLKQICSAPPKISDKARTPVQALSPTALKTPAKTGTLLSASTVSRMNAMSCPTETWVGLLNQTVPTPSASHRMRTASLACPRSALTSPTRFGGQLLTTLTMVTSQK